MVKKIVQDVVPPAQKSIRHIPLNKPRSQESDRQSDRHVSSPETPVIPPTTNRRPRKDGGNGRKFFTLWTGIAALGAAILIVFLGSWLFSSATVTIEPKQENGLADLVLESQKDDPSAPLSHEVITATSTQTDTVKATTDSQVYRKASGQIMIYNNYSSAAQRLIKNTRFQSADGRIYRIDASVVVPGQSVQAGKTTPGSLLVTVNADAAGAEYNLKLSDLKGDFTIPGFKGTPRYTAFYARQVSDISGGFSGMAKTVSQSDLSAVETRLKASLSDDLMKSISGSLPKDHILFPGAFFVDYSDLVPGAQNGDAVNYSMSAVAHAVIFDRLKFGAAVATKMFNDYDKNPVIIENADSLQFVPKTAGPGMVWQNNPFVFSIKGNADFVWQFDSAKMAQDLAAKTKKNTGSIMKNYPAVTRAEVVIRPFWKQAFPADAAKINIKTKLQ